MRIGSGSAAETILLFMETWFVKFCGPVFGNIYVATPIDTAELRTPEIPSPKFTVGRLVIGCPFTFIGCVAGLSVEYFPKFGSVTVPVVISCRASSNLSSVKYFEAKNR